MNHGQPVQGQLCASDTLDMQLQLHLCLAASTPGDGLTFLLAPPMRTGKPTSRVDRRLVALGTAFISSLQEYY